MATVACPFSSPTRIRLTQSPTFSPRIVVCCLTVLLPPPLKSLHASRNCPVPLPSPCLSPQYITPPPWQSQSLSLSPPSSSSLFRDSFSFLLLLEKNGFMSDTPNPYLQPLPNHSFPVFAIWSVHPSPVHPMYLYLLPTSVSVYLHLRRAMLLRVVLLVPSSVLPAIQTYIQTYPCTHMHVRTHERMQAHVPAQVSLVGRTLFLCLSPCFCLCTRTFASLLLIVHSFFFCFTLVRSEVVLVCRSLTAHSILFFFENILFFLHSAWRAVLWTGLAGTSRLDMYSGHVPRLASPRPVSPACTP